MRLLVFLLCVLCGGISVGHVCAQSAPAPAVDPNVVLKVTIASDQREFRMGETIPLQLNFSSTRNKRYQLNMAQYDRSGRMSYEQFNLSPSGGAVDPLPNWGLSLGGLTSYEWLTPEPRTIKLNLNEWVRFTQPGEYRLTITSDRVGGQDQASPSGSSTVLARSNEITLKIVKADPAWQKRVFKEAVAKLDAPAPGKPDQTRQYEAARTQAAQTLRFLGTTDAAREMVKRMRGDKEGGLEYVFMLGVISSPERSIARTALEEAFADPNQPIDATILSSLRTINLDNNSSYANWRQTQQRVIEQLLAALPSKRDKALTISLSTALNEAWNLDALPQQTTEKLTGQLVSLFDKLPLNEQNALLNSRWEKIKSPALIPTLKRYAQSYRDFSEMNAEPAYQSRELSGNALRRWYELDPAGARSAVITEISRPRPRYGTRVLGLLPDKTLPEVDFLLVEHFTANDDFDGKSHLASLIARYATDAILPQMIEVLDSNIGKWACDIQDPILAYVLRVSPVSARPRIEKAIALRGEDFTACNHGLFQALSETNYDPILEEIAIKSLNDPDPEVAQTAATMLGKFGSPAAESALLERYASWAEQWSGREAELNKSFTAELDKNVYQLGLGLNLVQALATGKSWFADKAALQRLGEQTKVRRIQHDVDGYLRSWEKEPLTISVDMSRFEFHAHVVQYEFQSVDALKEKLLQFPTGTTFALFTPTSESSASQTPAAEPSASKTIVELQKFLTAHGMSVAASASP